MFCLKCGKEIDDSAMSCPYCNCPTENAGTSVNSDIIDPSAQSADNFGLTSIVLGAIGIAMAWLIAIIGWICGGAGLAVALVGRNKNPFSQKAKTGVILSAVALGCSFISSLIGMLMMM